MWGALKAWRRRRLVQRYPLPDDLWQTTLEHLTPLCAHLAPEQLARLRWLSTLFVHDKAIYGASELDVDLAMALCVAVQACLPILALGPDWYDDWDSVVLYPDTFIAPRRRIDEAGVVHFERQSLSGEAWEAGPVILAWPEARCAVDAAPGHHHEFPHHHGPHHIGNVVIHECAHQLDQRNGVANGMPPLHPCMSRQAWTATFSRAYDALCAAVAHTRDGMAGHTMLDPYGAQSPAEFFAVASEHFFVRPHHLRSHEPALYRQLALFYRQDPAGRAD